MRVVDERRDYRKVASARASSPPVLAPRLRHARPPSPARPPPAPPPGVFARPLAGSVALLPPPPDRDPRPAAEADVLPEVRRPMSVVPPRPGALSGMARRLTKHEARRMAALRKTHGAGSGRPPGPKMPCGWKCGAQLTAAEMHGRFPVSEAAGEGLIFPNFRAKIGAV